MSNITLGVARRMHEAYLYPLSMREVGQRFGVSKNTVARAFRDWGLPSRPRGWNAQVSKPRRNERTIVHFTPPIPPKTFCGQCERRVTAAEAGACGSQFCKAREMAA